MKAQEQRTLAPNGHVRIMVVDDEPAITELLALSLRAEGWQVSSASSGSDALTLAETYEPHAVVLDVMLPGVDGLQVLRRLKIANPNRPVVLLTARDSFEDRLIGLIAGADAYLTKPFAIAELVDRLRLLLLERGQSGPAGSDAVTGSDVAQNIGTKPIRGRGK